MCKNTKQFLSGRNVYLIISITLFIVAMAIGTLLLGPKIVQVAKDPEAFIMLVGKGGIKSHLIFLCIQLTQIIFAFIPGEVIEVGAGYAFGAFEGTVLCLIGTAIATIIIFGITRLLGRKFTEIMIDSRDLKRLKFLQNEKKLTLLFALLYFIPGTPKDLITYFAGVTKIKFGTFLIISVFCRIPSILTSTMAGSALGAENYKQSILIFAITGAIGICGYLLYNYISRKLSDHKKEI